MQYNPKDPLPKLVPPNGYEVFQKLSAECAKLQAPVNVTVDAGANLIMNGVRQTYDDRKKCTDRIDEICAGMKKALDQHYDSHGRKSGIFPYPQTINMSLIDLRTARKN